MAKALYDFNTGSTVADVEGIGKIELAARFGYAAKGVVYGSVGALILMAVLGFARGDITGTRGALEAFDSLSWGPFMLAIITAGLLGFAIWRGFQAILDVDDKGDDAMALMKRGGLLVSGAIYASLAFYSAKLLFDLTAGGGGSADQRASHVMTYDGGALLIGVLGVTIIGVGLYQGYRVFNAKFTDRWKTSNMSPRQQRLATLISKFGIGARAVAFLLIGMFLTWGALTGQPDKAQGMEGALTELAQQSFGQTLVGIAGVGLVCYGIYCMVNALFRRIDRGESNDLPIFEPDAGNRS